MTALIEQCHFSANARIKLESRLTPGSFSTARFGGGWKVNCDLESLPEPVDPAENLALSIWLAAPRTYSNIHGSLHVVHVRFRVVNAYDGVVHGEFQFEWDDINKDSASRTTRGVEHIVKISDIPGGLDALEGILIVVEIATDPTWLSTQPRSATSPHVSDIALPRLVAQIMDRGAISNLEFILPSSLSGARSVYCEVRRSDSVYADGGMLQGRYAALDEVMNGASSPTNEDVSFGGKYEYESDSDMDEDGHNDFMDLRLEEMDKKGEDIKMCDITSPHGSEHGQLPLASSSLGLLGDQAELYRGPRQNSERQHDGHISASSQVTLSTGVAGMRRIVVRDFAWKTWRAFIFWVLTGQIVFKSRSPSNSIDHQTALDNLPSPVSAKSVYRLAKRMSIKALKHAALDHIQCQLRVDHIIEELFSGFTANHPAVRDVELEFFSSHRDHIRNTPELSKKLEVKLTAIASGKLPHAGPILARIFAQGS